MSTEEAPSSFLILSLFSQRVRTNGHGDVLEITASSIDTLALSERPGRVRC
jgi:hypothetical protein